MNKNKL